MSKKVITKKLDRKKNHDQLNIKDETIQTLINASGESAILMKLNGLLVHLNEIAAKRLNKPTNELIGKIIYNHLPENISEKTKKVCELLIQNKEPIRYNDDHDGAIFDNKIHPILNPNGDVCLIAIFSQDITDRKTAETALKRSMTNYKTLFDNALVGIVISNLKGQIIEANQAMTNLSGFTHQEILEMNAADVYLYPADRAKIISKLIQDGHVKDYEVQLKNKFGDGYWACFNSEITEFNEEETFLSSIIDINDRKLAETALLESENRFRSLVESMNEWVWEVNAEGIYTYVSPIVYDLLGYQPEEILGKTLFHIIAPEDKERIAIEVSSIMKSLRPFKSLEKKCIHKHGHIVIHEASGVPLFNDENILIGFRGVNRDITQKKNSEIEKKTAQKNAAKNKELALIGQIAGKMAHDFNNILGIIMGNTELSLIECHDINIKKTLELIFEQTLRGKNLTKNLVAFAKSQEPKQAFFRISEKIDLVLSLLKKDLEGIDILREDKSGIPELLADPGMIEHAFVNLIQNAIHATSRTSEAQIMLRTYCLNEKIYFEIEDNGCGIQKENLKSIYTPSFSLKGSNDTVGSYRPGIKGTGYGMANVKKYIEQHGGDILVESRFGFLLNLRLHCL